MLDAVEARDNGDLAFPLPVQMIAEIVGVPPQLFEQLKLWSNRIVQGIGRIPEHGYARFEEAVEAADEALKNEEEGRQYAAEEVARFNEQGVQQSAAGDEAEVEVSDEDSLLMHFHQQIQERRACGTGRPDYPTGRGRSRRQAAHRH